MFSLARMTAPIPRQMATFSSQPTVTKRPLARPGGGAAWCAALWAWPALTPLPVGPVPVQKQEGLLSAQEDGETLPDIRCLVATAVITLFNVSDTIRDVTQTGGCAGFIRQEAVCRKWKPVAVGVGGKPIGRMVFAALMRGGLRGGGGSVCCLRKSSREVPPGSRTGAPGTHKQGPFFPIHLRSVKGQFI